MVCVAGGMARHGTAARQQRTGRGEVRGEMGQEAAAEDRLEL